MSLPVSNEDTGCWQGGEAPRDLLAEAFPSGFKSDRTSSPRMSDIKEGERDGRAEGVSAIPA